MGQTRFDLARLSQDVLLARKRSGRTQLEVAVDAGVKAVTVSRIENATGNPRIENLLGVTKVLKLRLADYELRVDEAGLKPALRVATPTKEGSLDLEPFLQILAGTLSLVRPNFRKKATDAAREALERFIDPPEDGGSRKRDHGP